MKILFLAINLGGGGAERVLVNLVNQMADDGYDITLRVLSNNGCNRQLLSTKIQYEYIFRKSFRGMNYLYILPHKWIYGKIAYGNFDVIVVYLHGVLTRIVSYAPIEQKTIAYLHANMEISPFIQNFRNQKAIQKCFSNYNRIVSVSEDVRKSFVNVSGIDDNRMIVLYNTFDIKTIMEKSCEIVARNTHKLNMCSVGKLQDVKGYLRLARVMKRLCDEDLDVYLTIVGEGNERQKLEHFIQCNHLENHIILTGFDSNPYKYIAQSDLFVCSSYTEGFSSVVAESLIIGVPVLTTNCSGMREMLGDNEYGVIVENNEEALYGGLKHLLTNPDLLESYKKKAIERGTFFSPATTVAAVEKMLEEVMHES